MSIGNELGLNFIPQYTDFSIKFANITKDGSGFSFSTVGRWRFVIASGLVNPPMMTKVSDGAASGDFTIDTTGKNVTVYMRTQDVGYSAGQYFVALFPETSGRIIAGHLQKYITIQNQLNPTGI